MSTQALPQELAKYQDQIQHLFVYIQSKGLTFSTEAELKAIMKQWINDGLKFSNKMQTPQGLEFMYQNFIKGL